MGWEGRDAPDATRQCVAAARRWRTPQREQIPAGRHYGIANQSPHLANRSPARDQPATRQLEIPEQRPSPQIQVFGADNWPVRDQRLSATPLTRLNEPT